MHDDMGRHDTNSIDDDDIKFSFLFFCSFSITVETDFQASRIGMFGRVYILHKELVVR
jgi:hypothetical protein